MHLTVDSIASDMSGTAAACHAKGGSGWKPPCYRLLFGERDDPLKRRGKTFQRDFEGDRLRRAERRRCQVKIVGGLEHFAVPRHRREAALWETGREPQRRKQAA